MRTLDEFGRLYVSRCAISKASVCKYLGAEIKDVAINSGGNIDLHRMYRIYREPGELAKAVKTFNALPLLCEHEYTDAVDHPFGIVVGATGTEAEFSHPYLYNSLVIWPQKEIHDASFGRKQQFSCGYRYDVIMEKGISPEGEEFDGYMLNLRGNHVALVKEGRVGSDCCVPNGYLG